jgi:hypothetical protein
MMIDVAHLVYCVLRVLAATPLIVLNLLVPAEVAIKLMCDRELAPGGCAVHLCNPGHGMATIILMTERFHIQAARI